MMELRKPSQSSGVTLPDISFFLNKTTSRVDEYYERNNKVSYSSGIAISELGEPCSRKLWYKMRHYLPKEQFQGRMLRLFETGNRAETTLVTALQSFALVGRCQEKVEACDGHLRGMIDGVVLGLPEAPKSEHLAEFKSHSQANFDKLHKDGIKAAFFKHFTQFQIYSYLLGISRWLYLAINKNDDAIYQERGETDTVFAQAQIQRAERIIKSEVPPEKIDKAESYTCRYCVFHDICHYGAAHEINDRNNGKLKPGKNGSWIPV